jgi:hypothetical protein
MAVAFHGGLAKKERGTRPRLAGIRMYGPIPRRATSIRKPLSIRKPHPTLATYPEVLFDEKAQKTQWGKEKRDTKKDSQQNTHAGNHSHNGPTGRCNPLTNDWPAAGATERAAYALFLAFIFIIFRWSTLRACHALVLILIVTAPSPDWFWPHLPGNGIYLWRWKRRWYRKQAFFRWKLS